MSSVTELHIQAKSKCSMLTNNYGRIKHGTTVLWIEYTPSTYYLHVAGSSTSNTSGSSESVKQNGKSLWSSTLFDLTRFFKSPLNSSLDDFLRTGSHETTLSTNGIAFLLCLSICLEIIQTICAWPKKSLHDPPNIG
jgi:hypothetical protein